MDVGVNGSQRRAEYKSWYQDVYLRSEHWRDLRRWYAETFGLACSECGIEQYVQLHHLHYRTLGCERLEDLEPLCRAHHKRRHGLEKREPKEKLERKSKRMFPNLKPGDVVLGYADNKKGKMLRALDQERIAAGLEPFVKSGVVTYKKVPRRRSLRGRNVDNRRLRAHLR